MSDKNLTLFEGQDNAVVTSDLYKSLQEQNLNDTLGANKFTSRRLSIRGSKFREVVNGEQIKISKSDTMNIIIIAAAPIARTYYEGDYDADVTTAPVCWSNDTDAPASDVESPQATRCADCPQNIKGSGQGQSRACRYSQRLAVTIENDMEKIYQIQMPATSIFGDAENDRMPMQSYARFLQAHNTPAIAVVTQMSFDENADVPKLFFTADRVLTEDELTVAVSLIEHEDTKNAITFKVFDTDKGKDAGGNEDSKETPAPKAKPKAKAKPKLKAVETEPEQDDPGHPIPPEEEIAEPTKVEKESVPAPDDEKDLSSLIDDWDA